MEVSREESPKVRKGKFWRESPFGTVSLAGDVRGQM
jgi:hypothetical protein